MNVQPDSYLVRSVNRIVDLFCDGMVIAILLVAVRTGVLPDKMSVAVIGYALRSLVHPSLSLGIFHKNYTVSEP